jgi:putative FmdB family regulatory protein
MPIYEYRCNNGHLFEVMQKITDDPVTKCETCEAPVQRVFHPVAVHFKGSGFYNTDYGTAKRKREQDRSKKPVESSSSDSSTSTGTESAKSSSTSSETTTKSSDSGSGSAKPTKSSG